MSDLWLQLPNAVGLIGSRIAGRKLRWGWGVLILTEGLWALWGFLRNEPGIYPWCVLWSIVYGKNWWDWRRDAIRG